MRQQNWLNDTYKASKTRQPIAAPNPMPPTMLPGNRGPMPSMPSLGFGVPSGAKPVGAGPATPQVGGPPMAAPPPGGASPSSMMPSLMGGSPGAPGGGATLEDMLTALRAHPSGSSPMAPAPTTAGMTHGSFGGGFGGPGPTTPGNRIPNPTPAPLGPPPAPPANPPGPAATAPPGPGTPGYVGPGPVVGTGAYPTGYDSPANAYAGMNDQMIGAGNYSPFYSPQPAYAGNAWLAYLMADPYNRMITDSAEKQTLEQTNTAFDAARGKMKSDALQSGASEGGVAQGNANALSLAKGSTQAKNVRDFEQYKTDKGDERLKELLMPYLSQINASMGHAAPDSGPSKSQQYLQYAALIASLFA